MISEGLMITLYTITTFEILEKTPWIMGVAAKLVPPVDFISILFHINWGFVWLLLVQTTFNLLKDLSIANTAKELKKDKQERDNELIICILHLLLKSERRKEEEKDSPANLYTKSSSTQAFPNEIAECIPVTKPVHGA